MKHIHFKFFTDGSVKSTAGKNEKALGPAGWAYLIIVNDTDTNHYLTKTLKYGNSESDIISRTELTAIYKSLVKVSQNLPSLSQQKQDIQISIFSDLGYAIPVFERIQDKWEFGKYENDDIWAKISEIKLKLKERVHSIQAFKVKAHQTKTVDSEYAVFNGIVDTMAVHARRLVEKKTK